METRVAQPDAGQLEAWVRTVGLVKAQSTAAQVLTSLNREGRREAVDELKGRTNVPASAVRKRLREFRANPKRLPMAAGTYLNPYEIREALLSPKQTGHPGRPRKSKSKKAKADRARRAAQGAKAPRKGGVRTGGRFIAGAWIGKTKSGKGRKAVNVLERRGDVVARAFREWEVASQVLEGKLQAATGKWAPQYAKALQKAINRTRATGAAR